MATNESGKPDPQSFDETFLGGRVLKRTLPVLERSSSGPMPSLKRLLLPQGELAQIHDDAEGMRYIAVVELRAGAVRGNHFHNVKQEWFYVCQGEVSLKVAHPPSGVRETIPVRAGDLVFIPAGVAHSIRTLQPGHALEFAPTQFDPADVQPFTLA